MNDFKKTLINEEGLSMIEILAAVVILGIALLQLSSLMYQNFIAIDQNKLKEEAIFVREDIKEWLTYRAQNQDVANLNTYALLWEFNNAGTYTEEQTMRRKHFILDETGIQVDVNTGENIYGEIAREASAERGELVSKVRYDFSGSLLPDALQQDPYNKYYIGEYIDSEADEPLFLVKILVEPKDILNKKYDARTGGVGLNILIYSKETGKLLTETYLNFVAAY
ncbi:type IV pilus modification PilV family protein [Isobaculum melis]|uniref:Prepilin-type N-terminal cleavage/methylation domain-containing protein n=1 Tax=Isobaculum melis TaxID=142588 RepID=A0A1H9S2Y6_9LACT|nr:hypothetical protein [Isobaculum melis]SER79357.1 hypothetical protein SAMN04488559_10671 [Isobaculum melis]